MTQGRTRRIQDKLKNAREFTRALARYESGNMKTADAYKRLKTWQELMFSRKLESWQEQKYPRKDYDALYSIPNRQHFYTWWEQDLEYTSNLNFQEWVKPYTPATMHNNPFWNTPNSPYQLVDSNKELLVDAYNVLSRTWFLPLGLKKPVMTVGHAVWICIIVNTQPDLRHKLLDAFLFAEYFSAVHMDRMHDRDNKAVTPTTAPLTAVDDDMMYYLECSPWVSEEKYLPYHDMTNRGFYSVPDYAWKIQQFFLEPQNSDSNYIQWQIHYPKLYGSQIRNMSWNPPNMKSLSFLAGACEEILNYFITNNMVEDMDTVENMIGVTNDVKELVLDNNIDEPRKHSIFPLPSIVERTIHEDMIYKGNDMFDVSIVDRYYRLLVNLYQYHYSEPAIPQGSGELLSSPIIKEYLKKSALKIVLPPQ